MAIKTFSFLGPFLAGLGAIVIGYIALASGSMTVAPALLVAGYCLLIPWALFKMGHSEKGSGPSTPSGE